MSSGFIDFLLLNGKGFPFIVLEAKSENKNSLVGKEQARKYARSQNCRFVILSNGNLHYFWDLERGNPYVITAFPTPVSVTGYQKSIPNPKRLVEEKLEDDYIVLSQRPGYAAEAAWKSDAERAGFIQLNGLRFLRHYQKQAIYALQSAVEKGQDRFLFEMATGTGKTLTSAAVIKLFLRTGNARRVLFLVDRLELEDQAKKAFTRILANDYKTVIYKEIEAEQALVAANRELVDRFEKKIQAALARIWGEDASPGNKSALSSKSLVEDTLQGQYARSLGGSSSPATHLVDA